MMATDVTLSVVIPAYLEEENLRLLLPRLKNVLVSLGVSLEVLVVDNASTDASVSAIERLYSSAQIIRNDTNAAAERRASRPASNGIG